MFDVIEKALQSHSRKVVPLNGLVASAVLVPVFKKGTDYFLLMAKRTDQVLKHKNQISFPGGVQDPEDRDLVATALREAHEEVGLKPEDVRILGLLGDVQTFTNFRITPVVAEVPYPYPFKTSPVEVAELLEVPWNLFSEQRSYRKEEMEYNGEKYQVDFYDYQHHVIWGATARITRELLELLKRSERSSLEGK